MARRDDVRKKASAPSISCRTNCSPRFRNAATDAPEPVKGSGAGCEVGAWGGGDGELVANPRGPGDCVVRRVFGGEHVFVPLLLLLLLLQLLELLLQLLHVRGRRVRCGRRDGGLLAGDLP